MAVLDADQPLVLSAYSIGTQVSFEERVSIAAETGFAGIGLRAEDYWAARETGLDDAEMKEILDRHEIDLREVEYLTDCELTATLKGRSRGDGRRIDSYALDDPCPWEPGK